jgi:urease subunit gamma
MWTWSKTGPAQLVCFARAGPSQTLLACGLGRHHRIHGHSPCHALAGSPALQLTPRESEKLLVYVAADLARRRRGRGLKLNLPEAVALITEAMLEAARDGRRAAEVMALGREVLSRDDVMAEVPELLHVVQVEATFPDGTKLLSCHDPIP